MSNKEPAFMEKKAGVLAYAFAQKYMSIAQVDLHTGTALVLKSDADKEIEGASLPWEQLLQRYAQRRVYCDDRTRILSLTIARLEGFLNGENGVFPLEARCNSQIGPYDWIEIEAAPLRREEGAKLLITTRNINESRMMRSIIDLFVYQNHDYVILVDSKQNRYTRFSGEHEKTPIPPTCGNDYTADMLRFNRRFVAPEDFERVTRSMQLPHVIQMLEKAPAYSFSSGGIGNDGAYRRSRVQFIYYDKPAGLILLTRSDVTQIYREEQMKNAQLAAALREAQHDALTGLYNHKATIELITRVMESQYRSMAAMFFLDVDNFKLVNDTLGHQRGDELLQFLANSLHFIAGREGIAGRIGGDEYLLFLPCVANKEEVEWYASRLCSVFSTAREQLAQDLPISCSVGISLYPHDGTDYETLVQKADQALYVSKRRGKNRFHFYSEHMEASAPKAAAADDRTS